MGVQLTQEMISGAQETQKKYGVPASITLAQILQESGGDYPGGLSGLAYKYNNLFGIKGKGTKGSVAMSSREEGQGYVVSNFATYNNFAESIEAHGKLLATEHYTQYTSKAKSVEDYARALKEAGYATDSNYANALINQIKTYNLTQYDSGVSSGGLITSSSNSISDDLKWYGDIAVILFVIILIVFAVIFFLGAFDIKMTTPKKAMKEVAKKAVKK